MTAAYVNRIGTATPPFDVHRTFCEFAASLLGRSSSSALFRRMAARAQIDHRYSFISPASMFAAGGFYEAGRFPDTAGRMRFFERSAPALAFQALEEIGLENFGDEVTHLIVACCTGFYAPGLDIEIGRHFKLKPTVERTIIGFMGCYAAISALKFARHIVRSEPSSKVVIVNLELCTLHLQDVNDLEQMLCFLLWGDGCSAMLVTAEQKGLELQSFNTTMIGGSADHMSWRVGRDGFDMMLSGRIAQTLSRELPAKVDTILSGRRVDNIDLWAVHPGGRSILDAIETVFHLPATSLAFSRSVLREYGNMSSATIAFVLKAMFDQQSKGRGCAMAFGPGLTAESMTFEIAD